MFYLLIQFRISYIWFKSLFHNFFKQVVLSLFFRKTTKIISYRMVLTIVINIEVIGFLNGSVVKHPLANAGDVGSISGSGRCPGEENDNSLQYSCLRNPKDNVALQDKVHGVMEELDTT